MQAGDSTELPALQLLNMLKEQAPSEMSDFWRYATAAVARFLPAEECARQRYFSDLRVVLRMAYTTKYDMPDDKLLTRQVDEALAVVEAYSVLYWH